MHLYQQLQSKIVYTFFANISHTTPDGTSAMVSLLYMGENDRI